MVCVCGGGIRFLSAIGFLLRFSEFYKIIFKRHEIGIKKSEEPELRDIKWVNKVSGLAEVRKGGRKWEWGEERQKRDK